MVFDVPVPVRAGGTGGDTGKSPVPLPIGTAFRRALQLLAAGIFLPGSQSICDPCEKAEPRIHTMLSLEAQVYCCMMSLMMKNDERVLYQTSSYRELYLLYYSLLNYKECYSYLPK